MEKERRRQPRTPSHMSVDVYDPKGKAVTAEAQVLNVSPRGALLETTKPFKLAARLHLRYQPGKQPVFDVDGKIVWVHPVRKHFRYGVLFDARALKQGLQALES